MKLDIKKKKRCSTPLAIREIKIKTTRYPYTPIRMAKMQKIVTKPNAGWEKLDHTSLVGIENGTATLGNSLAVSSKTKPAKANYHMA